jgi:uncharacterized membrane protein YdjX (TVP38/TMEM64 family)
VRKDPPIVTGPADMTKSPAKVRLPKPGRPSTPVLLGAGLIALTLIVWGYALLADMPVPGFELSADGVADLIRSWGAWGVAATLLLMVAHSIVPFPAEFVAIAAGVVYGPFWGTIITWSGAMLGAWLSFGLARQCGRPLVEALVAKRFSSRLDEWAANQGAATLFVSRLIPVIAFNLINYAAGLTTMRWWTFTWVTGLGILPLTALMVILGDQMHYLGWIEWLLMVSAAIALWLVFHVIRRARMRTADLDRNKG